MENKKKKILTYQDYIEDMKITNGSKWKVIDKEKYAADDPVDYEETQGKNAIEYLCYLFCNNQDIINELVLRASVRFMNNQDDEGNWRKESNLHNWKQILLEVMEWNVYASEEEMIYVYDYRFHTLIGKSCSYPLLSYLFKNFQGSYQFSLLIPTCECKDIVSYKRIRNDCVFNAVDLQIRKENKNLL